MSDVRLPSLEKSAAGPVRVVYPREEDQGSEPTPLFGSWLATRWEYRGAHDLFRTRDVVAGQGGSVTLSLGRGVWVLTCSLPHVGAGTSGGLFSVFSDTLALRGRDDADADMLRWRLSDRILTLRSDSTTCDFGGTGVEEPASLVAVLVRL